MTDFFTDVPDYECWRVIPDIPSHEVSSHGRVRHRNTGRIMQGHIMPSGVHKYSFRLSDRSSTSRFAHILVVEAFCDDVKGEGFQVGWKDGDCRNNHLDNLIVNARPRIGRPKNSKKKDSFYMIGRTTW